MGYPLDSEPPEPDLGLLHRLNDEDVLFVHKILDASYNIYPEGEDKWLTLRLEAGNAGLPSGEPDTEVLLELNMAITGMREPLLQKGSIIKIPSYSEKSGNLTNMYYHAHASFEDATVVVEELKNNDFIGRVYGRNDSDPIAARACFRFNSQAKRSFS